MWPCRAVSAPRQDSNKEWLSKKSRVHIISKYTDLVSESYIKNDKGLILLYLGYYFPFPTSILCRERAVFTTGRVADWAVEQ